MKTTSNPAFLIGVTGHMDLRDEENGPLKERVRLLLRFLKHGPQHKDPDRPDRTLLQSLVEQLPPPVDGSGENAYATALADWPGLAQTPVIVLTALAPGADSLVAEVVLGLNANANDKDEFTKLDFHVRTPLPFPHELPPDVHHPEILAEELKLYRRASTFVLDNAPPEENQRRQEAYDRLVDALNAANTFPVMLDSDDGLSPDQQREQFLHDLNDRDRRRLRYYAAGEYNAIYAHLVVAIWDHHHDTCTQAGTAAIVEARLRGLRHGLLPTTAGLGLPHGGPLLHLYTRRAKNPAQPDVAPPAMRLLHPYASAPQEENGDERRQPNDAAAPSGWLTKLFRLSDRSDWQRNRLALFCGIVANLVSFNTKTSPAADDKVDQDMDKRLTWRDPQHSKVRFNCTLKTNHAEFHGALGHVVALHRRASAANTPLVHRTFNVLLRLFALTFLAAALLHLFYHWHPQEHGHADWKPWIGAGAMLFAGLALWVFWRHSSQQIDERAHDCRALAEGLRVQFFWSLAGLGRSVSANYMQRQRSELDWVRGAIRSVAFPYHRWRTRFAALNTDEQIAALRCVLDGWVREQCAYFVKRTREWDHRLHASHKLGGVLALAGLCVGLTLIVAAALGADEPAFGRMLQWGWIAVAAVVVASASVIRCYRRGQPRDHKPSPEPGAKTWAARWKAFRERLRWFLDVCVPLEDRIYWLLEVCHVVLGVLVPTTDAYKRGFSVPAERRREMAVNFLAHLPAASVIAYALLLCCRWLADRSVQLPQALHWSIVAGGATLLAGALLVAWSEKGLFSELAYQYNTMASLFRGAEVILERDLDELEQVRSDSARYAQTLSHIQALLYDLGLEALDENAEWLILHRARPLEPVMAG